MSKIAIISDIHSNYVALSTILKDIERRGINEIYCLGDIIPKYSEPDLVIDAVKQNCKIVIMGNGENNVANNPNYTYTWDKIGKKKIDYLKNLPFSSDVFISGNLLRMFHASPFSLDKMYNPSFSNEGTNYEKNVISNYKEMFLHSDFLSEKKGENPDIVAYGHTHLPLITEVGGKTIINPGSVGEPGILERIIKKQTNNMQRDLADEDDVKRYPNEEDKVVQHIGPYLSYVIIDGEVGSQQMGSLEIAIVKLSYTKELLLEVRSKIVSSGMSTTDDLLNLIDSSIQKVKR